MSLAYPERVYEYFHPVNRRKVKLFDYYSSIKTTSLKRHSIFSKLCGHKRVALLYKLLMRIWISFLTNVKLT